MIALRGGQVDVVHLSAWNTQHHDFAFSQVSNNLDFPVKGVRLFGGVDTCPPVHPSGSFVVHACAPVRRSALTAPAHCRTELPRWEMR